VAPGSDWECHGSFRRQYLHIGEKFNAAARPLNPIYQVVARFEGLVQHFLSLIKPVAALN
jgi:hypothetical protein